MKLGCEAVGTIDFPSLVEVLADRVYFVFTDTHVHGHILVSHRSTHSDHNPLNLRRDRFAANHGCCVAIIAHFQRDLRFSILIWTLATILHNTMMVLMPSIPKFFKVLHATLNPVVVDDD